MAVSVKACRTVLQSLEWNWCVYSLILKGHL